MTSTIAKALHADPAVRAAVRSMLGSDSPAQIEAVLTRPLSELVSKGTMLAMPKAAKRIVAMPKAAPTPKMPQIAKPPVAPGAVKPVTPVTPATPPSRLSKADDEFGVTVDFAKFDDDQHTVFGWASIINKDGEEVVDRQGDIIEPDEMAKAAYDYVLVSRKGGHQHQRTLDDKPLHVSDMIESMVFTPEKIEKMGLPPTTPVGWWMGFKVNDDEVWKAVKSGEITGMSVHGKGKRTPVA